MGLTVLTRKKNSVRIFAGKFSQTIMTVVKSQSFCGGQNGLTILAKIIFKSLENTFGQTILANIFL